MEEIKQQKREIKELSFRIEELRLQVAELWLRDHGVDRPAVVDAKEDYQRAYEYMSRSWSQ